MLRSTHRVNLLPALTGAVAALCVAGAWLPASAADESRSNPFRPEASADEEKGLEFKERLRDAIRDMLPEIRAKVQEDAEAQKAASIEATKRVILETIKNDPSMMQRLPGQGGPGTPGAMGTPTGPVGGAGAKVEPEMEDTALPEGAKFLVCINGKAEYQSKDGDRFFRELPKSATNPCAVGKLAALSPKKTIVTAVNQALGGAPAMGVPGQPGFTTAPGGIPGTPVAPPAPVMPGRPGGPATTQASPATPQPGVNPQTPTAQRLIPVAPGQAGRPAVPPPVVAPTPGGSPAGTVPSPAASNGSPSVTPAVSTGASVTQSNSPDMLRVTRRPGY